MERRQRNAGKLFSADGGMALHANLFIFKLCFFLAGGRSWGSAYFSSSRSLVLL